MLTAVHTDIAHARTPAAAFYTDAQILRTERERVFARAWQLVGHVGQLATPGDFFTTTLFEEPVLLVNDAGVLRGFFNVCRHRAGPVALGCGRQHRPGPYSPKRENGVHHFHRLMSRRLAVG